MSVHEIQSIIDDNKHKFKEGVYLELCNKMKKLYETKEDNCYVEVSYVYPRSENTHMGNVHNIFLSKATQIICMPKEEYESENDFFKLHGFISDTCKNKLEYHNKTYNLHITNSCCCSDEDDDDNFISIISNIKVMGFKLLN